MQQNIVYLNLLHFLSPSKLYTEVQCDCHKHMVLKFGCDYSMSRINNVEPTKPQTKLISLCTYDPLIRSSLSTLSNLNSTSLMPPDGYKSHSHKKYVYILE